MIGPSSLTWFARHEFGLFWRDWVSMMTAGKQYREAKLVSFLLVAISFMHVLAFFVLTPIVAGGLDLSVSVLVFIGGLLLLAFSLMLSQSMESVTRAFYARDDLDLILSSPAMVQRLFAVRISAIAITTLMMSLLLAFPFIDILIYLDGARWLAGYGILAAMAALATAIAVLVTISLFFIIGPARTRIVAQFIAAFVGAVFVIGIQIVAIIYYGNISRFDVLTSQMIYANAPNLNSWWWLPVRAFTGEFNSFIVIIIAGFGALAIAVKLSAPNFGQYVIAASGASRGHQNSAAAKSSFKNRSPAQVLRRKEWILLKRDPWLISQTLMQILYLLPPAFLLWRNYSSSVDSLVVLVPVIVMAAGQLAGGLAWLAVSGEDAPDLVATAPLSPRAIIIAKIEAVMVSIGCIVAPFIIALTFVDGWIALVTAIGVIVCSLGAVAIQLWFRKQARRTHFRRRQISSRAATFAEAFSSICWAGTAGIAAAGSWLAIAFVIPALLVLVVARSIAPTQE